MNGFEAVYERLNSAQREAVDTIFGPVLVIAGPGTGKTQLLSARVAQILRKTDALPQNILCLTFTENGAANMRERLTGFIGSAAYDVSIGTYHSFGSTVISRYPEYFTELRLERPVDELGKHQILTNILETMDYANPMKQLRHHVGDLVSTISEIKRGLLSPSDLRAIADDNLQTIETTREGIQKALDGYSARLPSKLTVALPLFENIHTALAAVEAVPDKKIVRYSKLALDELDVARETAEELGKTTPLTAWKNKWLVKDEANQYMLAGTLEARRIAALAGVLEQYEAALVAQGLYDFDDMILRAVEVLERNADLRFSLQEQHQFILLDEFQDTNAAQLRLVELLTNNPVSEGKPNVLAVGDDDQAIYAFQGAEASNMLDFFRLYEDVKVISLSENYRSKPEILQAAANVASQIEARLHTHFKDIEKTLVAKSAATETVTLERKIYTSSIAERTAVAAEISQLVQNGVSPSDIAVLAPKHKYLEPLVPYLHAHELAISYEKRENILDAPVIRQLLTMSQLVLALHAGNHTKADSLWPEVLSYDFWDFSTADIWQLSWRASDTHRGWSKLLLESAEFKHAALLMLTLAGKVETETLEYMLDSFIGTNDVQTHDRDLPSVRSPLRSYYFEKSGDTTLYETVTQLTVLRTRLREHQSGEGRMLTLPDLLEFIAAYEAAGQQMINTSPYNQAAEAVRLMTVFKAKGLEFAHVFLLSCDDSAWGSRASGLGNKLTLPANLLHIRHAGTTDDERLRLLFVAMTRAKFGLHLTSHASTFSGRRTESIKFFQEAEDDSGGMMVGILPEPFKHIVVDDSQPPALEALTMNWQQRHQQFDAPLIELLRERLNRYQLSPTHLTHFLDLQYGGPQSFLLGTLLRFPTAPTVDVCFGNAIHATLEWAQNELNSKATLPSVTEAYNYAALFLKNQPLTEDQRVLQNDRAQTALSAFFKANQSSFMPGNIPEKSFRDEGVFVGDVHLGGKVDLLEIDKTAKKITVVDYKTGRLGTDPAKLHRYTLQLYCYKLLAEGSHSFSGYTVEEGRLIFVEPDQNHKITEKIIQFEPKETERVRQLLHAMWHRVMTLDLPDVHSYGETLKDTLAFENALLGD